LPVKCDGSTEKARGGWGSTWSRRICLADRKSFSRPGVAITTSTPLWMAPSCGPLGAPPYTHLHSACSFNTPLRYVSSCCRPLGCRVLAAVPFTNRAMAPVQYRLYENSVQHTVARLSNMCATQSMTRLLCSAQCGHHWCAGNRRLGKQTSVA
jgi:hypothetical protein